MKAKIFQCHRCSKKRNTTKIKEIHFYVYLKLFFRYSSLKKLSDTCKVTHIVVFDHWKCEHFTNALLELHWDLHISGTEPLRAFKTKTPKGKFFSRTRILKDIHTSLILLELQSWKKRNTRSSFWRFWTVTVSILKQKCQINQILLTDLPIYV